MTNVLQNFKNSIHIILLFWFVNGIANTTPHRPPVLNTLDCDLCSCASSSGSLGQNTLNNISFIGTRYLYQRFVSKAGIFKNSPKSTEHFNTYQIWGRISISERFYLSAILPYQNLKRKFTHSNEHVNGIGDATLIGWFKIPFYKKQRKEANKNHTSVSKIPTRHTIEFGLGTKLPTGTFEQVLSDRINPGFQLGTGSLDGIVSAVHSYTGDTFGINTNLTYYAKGENKNEYRFGNQFSFSSNFFYTIPKNNFNIMPFIGVAGNFYDNITQFGETLENTNGTIYNASLGTEFLFNKFIIGGNYTLPIQHDLFEGNVTPKQSVSLYINYRLN